MTNNHLQSLNHHQTLAHKLGRLLPSFLFDSMQPLWHRVRDVTLFILKRRGRIWFNWSLWSWIASRPMSDGRYMSIVIRSYRELRRFYQFGHLDKVNVDVSDNMEKLSEDLVFQWMKRISRCEVLYDVGTANGLESFHVFHLHNCKIVMIEPFTPSIETILKTAAYLKHSGKDISKIEVVHAAIDEAERYQRLYMHSGPLPGSTNNSFANLEDYCRGGRQGIPVVTSQWVKSVTLDSLFQVHNLPIATHVKMDVDGFEDRAMRGAQELLKTRHVRSWIIEISEEPNLKEIRALMKAHGYIEVASQDHYPGYKYYCGDHLFMRDDLAEDWRKGLPI
ncbi:MAG: FkbM family methyltransferase [Alphaproteobacteria bacterium]